MGHSISDEIYYVAVVPPRDRGKCDNKKMRWSDFRRMLEDPVRDKNYTLGQYLNLSHDQQNMLKDVGSYVGGYFKNGLRRNENLDIRSMVSLDLDEAHPDDIDWFLDPHCPSRIWNFVFHMHTTRKHSKEYPRWRMIIPLSRDVTPEEYVPLSRYLASMVFETVERSMDAIDDVSFRPAQVAYKPSVCKNAEFRWIANDGTDEEMPENPEILDVDWFLRKFCGDWSDWSTLPYSEKRGNRAVRHLKKAENPRSKSGIVGAFCRTYDVPSVISEFLPDVYRLSDERSRKPRYTYVQGSSANGAVVEDDGLFLYSHHASDPCGERLVNAWDLVRIHKFGDLDKGKGGDLSASKYPSFQKMEEFARGDRRVAKQLMVDLYDFDQIDDDDDTGDDDLTDEAMGERREERKKLRTDVDALIEDLVGDEPSDEVISKTWRESLDVDHTGRIEPCLPNLVLIFDNDKRFRGKLRYDSFAHQIRCHGTLKSKSALFPTVKIEDTEDGDLWQDHHTAALRLMLETQAGKGLAGYGLKVTDRDLEAAILLAARKRSYHPIQSRILAEEWRGRRRVDTLFIDWLGTADNLYTRELARMFCTAAVARVFEPGLKFDQCVVLEGDQGARKTTFWKVLAFDRYSGSLVGDMGDRKMMVERMQGLWIPELGELSSLKKSEVEDIKDFLSSQIDHVRLSYDRRAGAFKRQNVIVATTNDTKYLKDTTGNRRFNPIFTPKVEDNPIDTDGLRKIVPQLWAEAYTLYREMREKHPKGDLPFVFSREALKIAREEQAERAMDSADQSLADLILGKLETPVLASSLTADGFSPMEDGSDPWVVRTRICALEIWCDIMGRDKGQFGAGGNMNAQSIGRAMQIVGWDNARDYNKDGSSNGDKKYQTFKFGRQRCYVKPRLGHAKLDDPNYVWGLSQGFEIIDRKKSNPLDLV